MTDASKAEIIASLEPLIRKAEREGLYIVSDYQGIWFSPAELRKEHSCGSFVWGPVNWKLRDPAERTAELANGVVKAREALTQWLARIAK